MKTASYILRVCFFVGICASVNAGEGFMPLPMHNKGDSKTGVALALATGAAAATYGLWYYYQSSRVSEAVRRAEAYLSIAEDPVAINILNWSIAGNNAFPTVVSINTQPQAVLTSLANSCRLFTEPFCQAQLKQINIQGAGVRTDYGDAIRAAIQYELQQIQEILNFCDRTKELTWIMSDMIQPQLNGRLYHQLNAQPALDGIDAAVSTYITRLGIPGGRWYESPGNAIRWVGAMFADNPFWMPTRVCRAFMFPYEGRIARLYWQLYKHQQRLFALRTVVEAHAIIGAPNQAIIGQSQYHHVNHQPCTSRYCPHRVGNQH